MSPLSESIANQIADLEARASAADGATSALRAITDVLAVAGLLPTGGAADVNHRAIQDAARFENERDTLRDEVAALRADLVKARSASASAAPAQKEWFGVGGGEWRQRALDAETKTSNLEKRIHELVAEAEAARASMDSLLVALVAADRLEQKDATKKGDVLEDHIDLVHRVVAGMLEDIPPPAGASNITPEASEKSAAAEQVDAFADTAVDDPFVIVRTVPKLGKQLYCESTKDWCLAIEPERATKYGSAAVAEGAKKSFNLRRTKVCKLSEIAPTVAVVKMNAQPDDEGGFVVSAYHENGKRCFSCGKTLTGLTTYHKALEDEVNVAEYEHLDEARAAAQELSRKLGTKTEVWDVGRLVKAEEQASEEGSLAEAGAE